MLFLCFSWPGRELGGYSMFCVSRLGFCVWPDMVLNQKQVLVVVSDWEPYSSSLFCIVVGGLLSM